MHNNVEIIIEEIQATSHVGVCHGHCVKFLEASSDSDTLEIPECRWNVHRELAMKGNKRSVRVSENIVRDETFRD